MNVLILVAIAAGALLAAALVGYAVSRHYTARTDRSYMTHDERGFKRALTGKGVLWNPEEAIVKGATAPKVEFVALDLATGQRKMTPLLDARSGAVNLRPQYCVPLPFSASTADDHRLILDVRVQFSLNRDLLKYVYQLEDFGLALETRIQSAFRAEIGMRQDEVLRASLGEVETGVVNRLRQAERDGDEVGEAGMALGVNFHTASFSFSVADVDSYAPSPMIGGTGAPVPVAGGAVIESVRQTARAQGVLALRPQQLDLLADVFKGRDPASTAAVLTMLDMQTRQNIAEALAASGQVVVVTSQELGLTGATAQRDAIASRLTAPPPVANGGAARV